MEKIIECFISSARWVSAKKVLSKWSRQRKLRILSLHSNDCETSFTLCLVFSCSLHQFLFPQGNVGVGGDDSVATFKRSGFVRIMVGKESYGSFLLVDEAQVMKFLIFSWEKIHFRFFLFSHQWKLSKYLKHFFSFVEI